MRPIHWAIISAAALGGLSGVFLGPWLLGLVPGEPVWLRPVAVIGLLLAGVVVILSAIALKRPQS